MTMTDAFLTWQTLVLVAVTALCWYFQGHRPSRHALLAIVCFGLSIAMMNAWALLPHGATTAEREWLLDYAYKVFNAGINGSMVVYLGVLFYFLFDRPAEDDLAAKLLWGCVLIAETFSLAVNNIFCNLVLEMATRSEIAETWGTSASRYVCGREVGEWLEYVPLLIEFGIMAWLVQRWVRAQELGKS